MSDESDPSQQAVMDTNLGGANAASTVIMDDARGDTVVAAIDSLVNDANGPRAFSDAVPSDPPASAGQPPTLFGNNSVHITAAQPQYQLPSRTFGTNQNREVESSGAAAATNQRQWQGSFVHFNNQIRRGVVSVPLQRQTIHSGERVIASGSVNVRVVHVDPLVPQPVPESYNNVSSSGVNTNGIRNTSSSSFSARRTGQDDPIYLERFKCDICFEYLKDPVGCGKCSSRFCRPCLERVFKSEIQRLRIIHSGNAQSSNVVANGNHPRCPTCRQEFEHIVPDFVLDHEIYHGPTLPCRYDGCNEDKLKLSLIAEHEQICGHAPMRCRYAAYGCSWTGKRCMIRAHELYGCKISPMGPFIDQFRSTKADHGTRLEMVAQQAVGSVRMNNALRQSIARDQTKSISDIFSILQYCQILTCATPHMLFTKDKWAAYWRSNESRAAVINVLLFSPFVLASFGSFSHGLNGLFHLLDVLAFANNSAGKGNSDDGISAAVRTVWNAKTERLLEDAFLGLCAGLLGIMAISLNFVDNKSSIVWRGVSIRHLGNPPIVCDLLAVSTFALLLAVLEYHGAGVKGIVLWMMVALCSTFFPALILSLSHYSARAVTGSPAPTAGKMSEMARSVEPLLFGLRFSLLATYFGIVPCVDAVIIVSLLPRGMLGTLREKLIFKDCFLDKLPRFFCLAFLGAKMASWTMQMKSLLGGQIVLTLLQQAKGGRNDLEHSRQQLWATFDSAGIRLLQAAISESIFATKALLLMNCFVYTSFHLGIKVGNAIASSSQAHVRLEGVAKEYSFLGILSFAGWAVTMALILQF